MPDPTLTEIAADIRKHAPDAITDSVFTLCGDVELVTVATKSGTFRMLDREKVARACLIAAMVMGGRAGSRSITRQYAVNEWEVSCKQPYLDSTRAETKSFKDSDHGGDPLLSLYTAWRWARGIQ
jgi:hypothetical protein